MRVTLIDNYDSFTFNLVHYLGELGADVTVWRNDEKIGRRGDGRGAGRDRAVAGPLHAQRGRHLPRPRPRSPAPTTPMLGVCLGHQAIGAGVRRRGGPRALADARQGQRDLAPGARPVPRRQRPVPGDALPFADHPPRKRPAELDITAETDDGIIMAVEHRERPVHGVQFHPESIASEHGRVLIGNFLDLARRFNAERRPA